MSASLFLSGSRAAGFVRPFVVYEVRPLAFFALVTVVAKLGLSCSTTAVLESPRDTELARCLHCHYLGSVFHVQVDAAVGLTLQHGVRLRNENQG